MQADPKPFVVTVIPQDPAPETTIADVVAGSFGIAGVLLLLALALGVVVAAVRLGWQRRHPAEDDHLPPVSPLVQTADGRPSSRSR